MSNELTNLKQAVDLELKKMKISPIGTDKFEAETNISPDRVMDATMETLKEMGINRIPVGDSIINSYLSSRGKTNPLEEGKPL